MRTITSGPDLNALLSAAMDYAAFLAKCGEMAAAASQTIFYRSLMMATAGARPNAAERREFHRMGAEKVAAAAAAGQAMAADAARLQRLWADQTRHQGEVARAVMAFASASTAAELMIAQQAYWSALWRGWDAGLKLWAASLATAQKGIRPIHARAAANARRLAAR
ncbi:MAG: hypothetical protein M3Z21_15605 [Pseudomonadota bacterium]|nr:hypothetical protein [Pseudomonadota bacterium]